MGAGLHQHSTLILQCGVFAFAEAAAQLAQWHQQQRRQSAALTSPHRYAGHLLEELELMHEGIHCTPAENR